MLQPTTDNSDSSRARSDGRAQRTRVDAPCKPGYDRKPLLAQTTSKLAGERLSLRTRIACADDGESRLLLWNLGSTEKDEWVVVDGTEPSRVVGVEEGRHGVTSRCPADEFGRTSSDAVVGVVDYQVGINLSENFRRFITCRESST